MTALPATSPAASSLPTRPVVAVVLQQHAEEAALLRQIRSVLVRAPHVGLLRLGRLDERLAAHLDGLSVAGSAGTTLCVAALERPGVGEVFALAALALENREPATLARLLALWPALPEARRGLISAIGWVPAQALQGVVHGLLAAPSGPAVALGIEACRLHQVDPGKLLATALSSADPTLRASAARAAGELGRIDLLDVLRQGAKEEAPDTRFWRAWAACLLGDRGEALEALADIAFSDGPGSGRAWPLLMAASSPAQASEWAQRASQAARAPDASSAAQRRLVRAIALLGDLQFVPWLIARMVEPALARLAGEAFHWVTGADLALLDLETLDSPPDVPAEIGESGEIGESDALDDDGLPWPDPVRVQAWWLRERPALEAIASGGRLFLGRPVNAQTARDVLTSGTQRQRAHAAWLASLLQPGRGVFQVAAPAARQMRALAERPD